MFTGIVSFLMLLGYFYINYSYDKAHNIDNKNSFKDYKSS